LSFRLHIHLNPKDIPPLELGYSLVRSNTMAIVLHEKSPLRFIFSVPDNNSFGSFAGKTLPQSCKKRWQKDSKTLRILALQSLDVPFEESTNGALENWANDMPSFSPLGFACSYARQVEKATLKTWQATLKTWQADSYPDPAPVTPTA